ncbi:hypothetical protein M413DRAFT_78715 [Hebeloma cylindrosporum]|uniref:DnaJ homologue subfamily C member 28 conserved domain-containing protein n=1 Tax=Hebeloma cylindrosporum TaxID=76867 RepID=A0A0C3BVH0_HEBCY|nr:hypothetical protein M413DRAFT_78715 [Hebeloma cylindrosporum h7]
MRPPATLFRPTFIRASIPSSHVFISQARWTHSNSSPPSQSASAKLFADAAKEEADPEPSRKSSRLTILEQEHENWTGDENIKDAVLRMLVDKYKPLRTGAIQTAEQKLKQTPPRVGFESILSTGTSSKTVLDVNVKPSTGSWATEPLLPSREGHQPWHTTFKVPTHDSSSVKLAHLPPPLVSSKATPLPLDDRARRLEKERKKRTEQAGRLTQARESTIDYRMGVKGSRAAAGVGRSNPVSVKGWASLVEDKIEKARKAGVFNTIQGRGKPLVHSVDEQNPFIAREEFLMNRIVQRNGAAPPWVEVQVELETAVNTFREILRQAWIRRAVRGLAMENPPSILSKFTLKTIKAHRDPDWVNKEKSYHETAVAELNSLVRKYNAMAPYAVRRPYYIREVEIERVYEAAAPDIMQMVAQRAQEADSTLLNGSAGSSQGAGGHGSAGGPSKGVAGASEEVHGFMSIVRWLRLAFRRLFGIKTSS